MQRLKDLSTRMSAFSNSLVRLVRASLEAHQEEVIDMEREQLLGGKNGNGEDIRPYYSEDLKANGGYFKSAESARAYANFKSGLTYPKDVARNPDAPNLYIFGQFHSELRVDFDDTKMAIVGSGALSRRVIAKYGEETFGITDENLRKLIDSYILPTMKAKIVGE